MKTQLKNIVSEFIPSNIGNILDEFNFKDSDIYELEQKIKLNETKTFSLKELASFDEENYLINFVEKKDNKKPYPKEIKNEFYEVVSKDTGQKIYFNKEDIVLLQENDKQELVCLNMDFNKNYFEYEAFKFDNFIKTVKSSLKSFTRLANSKYSCNGIEIISPSDFEIEQAKHFFGSFCSVVEEKNEKEKTKKLIILSRLNKDGKDLKTLHYSVTMLGALTFSAGAIATAPMALLSVVPYAPINSIFSAHIMKAFVFGASAIKLGTTMTKINKITGKIANIINGDEKEKILTLINDVKQNDINIKSHFSIKPGF